MMASRRVTMRAAWRTAAWPAAASAAAPAAPHSASAALALALAHRASAAPALRPSVLRRCMHSQTHAASSTAVSAASPVTPASSSSSPSSSAATSTSASPAAIPAADPAAVPLDVGDAGAPFVLVEPTDSKSRSSASSSLLSFRTKLALAALLGLAGFHIYQSRAGAVRDAHRELVSCSPNEIHDLINVFHFTTPDLESVYRKLIQRYPRGQVSIDDFAQLLADQVALVKERRRRQREQRARERTQKQYEEDADEVRLERDIARAQQRAQGGSPAAASAAAASLLSLRERLESMQTAHEASSAWRARQATADEAESYADEHKDNAFHPLDTYIFFRTTKPAARGTSPTYLSPALLKDKSPDAAAAAVAQAAAQGATERKMLLDYRDLMTGLATVIFDHVDLEERWKEREGQKHIPPSLDALRSSWSARDIEVFTRRPETKLHFAFRVADSDKDGALSFGELEGLFDRLIRTGHVRAESLVRHKQAWEVPEGAPSLSASALSAAAAPRLDAQGRVIPPSPFKSSAIFPYEFQQRTAAEIAQQYWAALVQRRRDEASALKRAAEPKTLVSSVLSLFSSSSPSAAAAPTAGGAAASASPSSFSPSSSSSCDRITWPEFLSLSRSFAQGSAAGGQTAALWYLSDTMPTGQSKGMIARARTRWAARFNERWNRCPTPKDAEEIDKSVLIAFAAP